MPIRIGYDARLALGNYRGMGRFLRALIAGRESDFVGFCAAGESDSSLNLVAGGVGLYPVWEQAWLPTMIAKSHLDGFLAPFNTAPLFLPRQVKLILVVHDLIFLERGPRSPSWYQNLGRVYRSFVVPRAIARADHVITVSKFTRDALARRFPSVAKRITVIPNTISDAWFEDAQFSDPQQRFILFVAGEAPSKNLRRAIEAFACVRRITGDSGLTMKVAGVKPRFHSGFMAQGRTLGLGDSLQMLGYVAESTMQSLFRSAELFVMPSLQEGFGIPLLEAMASGTPVACSSTSCLPEIAADAAVYFDPESVEDMTSAIVTVLSDTHLKAAMSARGKRRALDFHPSLAKGVIDNFWTLLLNDIASPK